MKNLNVILAVSVALSAQLASASNCILNHEAEQDGKFSVLRSANFDSTEDKNPDDIASYSANIDGETATITILKVGKVRADFGGLREPEFNGGIGIAPKAGHTAAPDLSWVNTVETPAASHEKFSISCK